jgi:uncharacterized membrane protein
LGLLEELATYRLSYPPLRAVGGVCPSGQGYVGYFECGTSSGLGGRPSAAASIAGVLYTLSSLADFTACGITASGSQAVAVSEDGKILVEAWQVNPSSVYTVEATCELTPAAPLADGTPHFTASALGTLFGRGINRAGTIVGGICPAGQSYVGYFECGTVSSLGGNPTAAALIGGKLYTLADLTNLADCGIIGSSSQALAVSEDGSILLEGFATGSYTVQTTCELTPTDPLADGTPQFVATPL